MESEQLSEADASLNPLVYKLPQISSGFPKQGVQIKKRITSHYSSGLHRTKKKQKQLNSERTTKTNFAISLKKLFSCSCIFAFGWFQ